MKTENPLFSDLAHTQIEIPPLQTMPQEQQRDKVKNTTHINLNSYIDLTLLRVDASFGMVSNLCQTAIDKGFYSVCVAPFFAYAASQFLKESNVKVCVAVGFPLGLHLIETKLHETDAVIRNGAQEVDVMWNFAAFKAGDHVLIKTELRRLRFLTRQHNCILKIILETGLLSLDEIKLACEYCVEAEVDFVKTSTGYVNPGAETEKVAFMRQQLPQSIQVKASGGIRTIKSATELIEAGATRLGTSSVWS